MSKSEYLIETVGPVTGGREVGRIFPLSLLPTLGIHSQTVLMLN